jgi:hypothetical protein
MYCPTCSSQIHNDVKFCTRCGANLTKISDLLNGRIIEPLRSEELINLMEKCHNGYLSTLIGSGLIITSLLIIITALMIGATPMAIGGLLFLGWAIPAIAQGVSKWLSARSEMSSIFGDRSGLKGEVQPQKSLPSKGARTDSHGFAGSVTEGTTASLDQRS